MVLDTQCFLIHNQLVAHWVFSSYIQLILCVGIYIVRFCFVILYFNLYVTIL